MIALPAYIHPFLARNLQPRPCAPSERSERSEQSERSERSRRLRSLWQNGSQVMGDPQSSRHGCFNTSSNTEMVIHDTIHDLDQLGYPALWETSILQSHCHTSIVQKMKGTMNIVDLKHFVAFDLLTVEFGSYFRHFEAIIFP